MCMCAHARTRAFVCVCVCVCVRGGGGGGGGRGAGRLYETFRKDPYILFTFSPRNLSKSYMNSYRNKREPFRPNWCSPPGINTSLERSVSLESSHIRIIPTLESNRPGNNCCGCQLFHTPVAAYIALCCMCAFASGDGMTSLMCPILYRDAGWCKG